MKNLNRLPITTQAVFVREKTEKPKHGLSLWMPLVALAGSCFAALASAYLYASHRAFSDAYFRVIGAPSGTFELNMQELMYSGALAGLYGVLVIGAAFLMAGFLVLLSTWFSALMGAKASSKDARISNNTFFEKVRKNIDPFGLGWSFLLAGIGAMGLILPIVYMALMIGVEQRGRDRAEEQLSVIERHDVEGLRKHRISRAIIVVNENGNAVTYSGYRIACQMEKSCVLRDGKMTRIVPLQNLLHLTLEDV
jgi:hypothetical protein